MGWGLAYGALLAALVVRLTDPAAAPRIRPPASPMEPLRLIGIHHAVFYALLIGVVPAEALLLGGSAAWRWSGLVLFGVGIALYRLAGRTLGDALSPWVEPAPNATLITHGPYRVVRHPMYLGQAMIALGAPLTLGCRWALALSGVALGVLMIRVGAEERALRRAYPEYAKYAAAATRGVPHGPIGVVLLAWAVVVYVSYWLRQIPLAQ
jgi:protein-S-isoprenylcysteine O-methyltransferase Ste14